LLLDYIIIIVYILGIALLGIYSGGKQKNVKDYFLGKDDIPWWAVCFSIVAAEMGGVTFISIPGLAYISNLNFLQVVIGYLIGRIVIAFVFLPAYFKGDLQTAYSYLENRFGNKTRSFASLTFIFTRLAADGVRLFATAIPIYLILKIDPLIAIILTAIVALLYTYSGGLRGIIWVDVFQMFIYIGGAIIAGIYILNSLPEGWNSVLSAASSNNKFEILNLGFDNGFTGFIKNPYTLIAGLVGGAFLSMASHGTDQLIVQRLLATKHLKSARKAVIGSGVIVIIQFALFLILGVMLYAYFGPMDVKSDEVFPMFIINNLPTGITGIIIAGLIAAAMSTLAGSMSSLSSSTMLDLYLPMTKKILDDKKKLKISRLLTIVWAALLVISALFFMQSAQAVVEIALSIASFTYGGLLGVFLLGILVNKSRQEDALAGFIAGIFIMITVVTLNLTGWTWYTLIGVSACIITGGILTKLSRDNKINS
jgi:solute:Na+ symporter, SSS family